MMKGRRLLGITSLVLVVLLITTGVIFATAGKFTTIGEDDHNKATNEQATGGGGAANTVNEAYIETTTEQRQIHKFIFNNRIYVLFDHVLKELSLEYSIDKDTGVISFFLDETYYALDTTTSTLFKNNFTKIKFSDPVVKLNGNYYIPTQYLTEINQVVEFDLESSELYLDVEKRIFNPNLIKSIDGKTVNAIDFDITMDKDLFWGSTFPRDTLTYEYDQIINVRNTHVIKGSYKYQSKFIEFSPYLWVRDFRQVVFYGEKNGFEKVQPIIDHMYTYISKFIIEDGDKAYTGYPFEYRVYNKYYEPGWQSALGNGHVIIGLMHAYESTDNQKYKDMADKLINGFLDVRDENQENWITFVDERGFLWLEEAPHPDEPQMRALNGHMGALEALYAYYLYEPREDVLDLIKAAATTVYYYIEDYRIPNNIHAYALYTDSVADYGQIRNLNQLEFLFKITKEPYFLFMRSQFDNDYRRSGKPIK